MPAQVLVANLSAPELRYLAAELARRQSLLTYVSRYANQGRWWENALRNVPIAGALYARSLGLRLMPEGLAREHVTEAGVVHDFAAAVAGRMRWPRATARRAAHRLHAYATAAIGTQAARRTRDADRVVAGIGMALPPFLESASRRMPRVLNYPSAHHRFQHEFFATHAERLPEFARLDDLASEPQRELEQQFDEECALADLILVGSRFARDSFAGQGVDASKVHNIPYGVDIARFQPAPWTANDRFRIVYVGRVSMRKGIGYLLHAYRRFRRPDTDLQLVGTIVGDAACLHPYEQLFTYTPHVPQAQLPLIYQEADVFVFPSLLEGLGLVALEAMACGCPVIVTENGPGDVVRDGVDGFVVPAADSQAIEVALTKLYRDPELRRYMGQMARQQAERYAWSRYASDAADAVLGAGVRGDGNA